MADVSPQHEVEDNQGSTVVYSGTATTTPSNVPAVVVASISGFALENMSSNEPLFISMDGGTTFKTVEKRAFFSWNIKGRITQVVIKTLASTADYEIIINFEDN